MILNIPDATLRFGEKHRSDYARKGDPAVIGCGAVASSREARAAVSCAGSTPAAG